MKIRLNRFPGGRHKALTMSYDDGVPQDKRLIELFDKHGIKGSFHLNSGTFGSTYGNGRIAADEIADVYKNHEISIHSLTHPFLETLSDTDLIYEIEQDRKNLEDIAGYPVRGMSYPYGTYSDRVLATLNFLGVQYSRTVNSTGNFSIPEKFLEWGPTCHHKGATEELSNRFLNEANWEKPSLYYVWGHSYEFDNDNNWNLIEDFCKLVSGKPEVWYATNIEVFDYVTAMRNLKFSLNRDLVYNPSALSVWISVDNESVEIKPGATVKL